MAAAEAKPAAAAAKHDPETEKKLDEWVAARRSRDFETADRLRAELRRKGVDANAARPPPQRKGGGGARKPSGRASILYPPAVGTEGGVRIVVTGGRCYRCPVRESRPARGQEDGMCMEGEDADVRYDPDTGHYVLTLGPEAVPPECFKFIIGSKRATQNQLEQDTGASIRIPKTKEEERIGIVLRGLNESSVIDAKHRIEYLVEKSRSKLGYTHFVSLPLVDSVMPRCEDLVRSMKRLCSPQTRVEPSVFQNPQRLHLTLLMLRLYSDEAKAKAAQCLKNCERYMRTAFTEDDRVHLSGLNYMNDDPSQVDVLYLSVAPNDTRDKILELVEHVAQEFILAGLATSREVEHTEKLHATLMNSKWRKGAGEDQDDEEEEDEGMPAPRGQPSAPAAAAGREGDWMCPNVNCGANNFASRSKCYKCGAGKEGEKSAPRPRRSQRIPFDIGDIMEQFGECDLGQHRLRRLEISELSAEVQENGYYKALAAARFP